MVISMELFSIILLKKHIFCIFPQSNTTLAEKYDMFAESLREIFVKKNGAELKLKGKLKYQSNKRSFCIINQLLVKCNH